MELTYTAACVLTKAYRRALTYLIFQEYKQIMNKYIQCQVAKDAMKKNKADMGTESGESDYTGKRS